MSDREQFEAARAAGLKARHETRVERAKDREFVQAELWKVANAARREVAEEIAAAIEAKVIDRYPTKGEILREVARIAREIGAKETS